MNIVLVMSDAGLWKPDYVEGVIRGLASGDRVNGAILTNFRPSKATRVKHLKRYFFMLGPITFFYIALREAIYFLANRIDRFIKLPHAYSIEGVCRRYGIPIYFTHDVNRPDSRAWLIEKKPDVMISSGNQIFKKEVLDIPSITCLNRHTSLLPSYAGIYPVFWNLLYEEEFAGVSIHTMTVNIDEGVVIAQERYEIKNNDTFFSIYRACFQMSVNLTLRALSKVKKGDFSSEASNVRPSYFSYPTWKDAKNFRRKGKRIL